MCDLLIFAIYIRKEKKIDLYKMWVVAEWNAEIRRYTWMHVFSPLFEIWNSYLHMLIPISQSLEWSPSCEGYKWISSQGAFLKLGKNHFWLLHPLFLAILILSQTNTHIIQLTNIVHTLNTDNIHKKQPWQSETLQPIIWFLIQFKATIKW